MVSTPYGASDLSNLVWSGSSGDREVLGPMSKRRCKGPSSARLPGPSVRRVEVLGVAPQGGWCVSTSFLPTDFLQGWRQGLSDKGRCYVHQPPSDLACVVFDRY